MFFLLGQYWCCNDIYYVFSRSYEAVEHCLQKCGGNQNQAKQTYAGLKLICQDYKGGKIKIT